MSTLACAFLHHRAALTTGYMHEPCAHPFQDAQLCCAHNERGSPRLRAELDLLREHGVTTAEQDTRLRLVLHHSQRNVNSSDFNTNFMVILYLLQEKSGPVCDGDRNDAKKKESRMRELLGITETARFERDAIERYAVRSQAEASLPTRLISELLEELKPLIAAGEAPNAAQRKIDAVLAGMPEDLFVPLFRPEESPWFQRAKL